LADETAMLVYKVTAGFPKEELFVLTSGFSNTVDSRFSFF
jgi:hypothetical protein